jgi:hypothetical protein
MTSSFSYQAAWRIALFAAAIAVLIAVVLLLGDDAPAPTSSEVLICEDDATALLSPLFNTPVGDVALYNMDRHPVMLHDLAGDAMTVIVFCSYRCPCSDGYIDRLAALREEFESRGVRFAAVHSNADETMDGMTSYIQRKSYPLPVYRDDLTAAADMMQATVTPEVFVFDTLWSLQYHGRVDDDKSGFFVEEESLRLALDTLLSGAELREKEKITLGCAIVRDTKLKTGKEE